MIFDDNSEATRKAAAEMNAAVDKLLALQGRPTIYQANAELTKIEPEKPLCTFCGKGVNQVEKMILGPGANICDQCVMLCYETIVLSQGTKNTEQ